MTKTELTNAVPKGRDHRELRADGQQLAYVVLSDEERAKGFVRPYRETYVHAGIDAVFDGPVLVRLGKHGCGSSTKMGRAIAETYARDPSFYSGTFCVGCDEHRPLAEFVWEGSAELVGT